MELSNESYKDMIKTLTDDKKIQYIFNRIPSSSINAYKKTLSYKATKEYGSSTSLLPNNFFALIESSLKEVGVLQTYKCYKEEFAKLQDFFGTDTKTITTYLRDLLSDNSQTRYKAVDKFKTLIRKYNSQYKGKFIKDYAQEKLQELKKLSVKINKKSFNLDDIKVDYSFREFFKDMKKNDPKFMFDFNALLEEASNVLVDDIYFDVMESFHTGASLESFLNLLGIYEPLDYDDNYIKKQKTVNRLKDNYEPLFNKNDLEHRRVLVQYINGLIDNNVDKSLIKDISTSDKINVDVCYKALRKVNGRARLDEEGYIRFDTNLEVSESKTTKYKEYKEQLNKVNKLLSYVFKQYKQARQTQVEKETVRTEYEEMSDTVFEDDNYTIPLSVYIKDDIETKMRDLIYGINKNKLRDLTPYELDCLNALLNSDALLFTYLIGNISTQELLIIINNYSSLLAYIKEANVEVKSFEDMLKIAKTFRFANDIDIALIGYDNLVKIINYNQFAGTEVTDEIIKARIKKARYLMTQAEQFNMSSLPYDTKVKKDGLILDRYYNNNPDALVSGIETKTCFFISVNENDFFFYSILNKNGFIVRITDEQGNFVARASCFRRNNALMINGIRLKNNEIIINNKEQKELMNKVVSLVEMMGEKIIFETTGNECPIDYVLCNKAGILENSEFDNRYEMIDFKLIREPIDVYNDDWKQFVDISKKDPELLQEVVDFPDKSFTTDFGDNYPLVLIKSRKNMGLLKPSDISLKTEDAIYSRPKFNTKIYTTEEIDREVLAKINRIRALYTFIGSTKRKQEYKLLKNSQDIDTAVVADDWVVITYKNGRVEHAYTNYTNIDYNELHRYASFDKIINKGETKEYKLKKYSHQVDSQNRED